MTERIRLTPEEIKATRKVEIITDPESTDLALFHRLLERSGDLGEDEVEDLEIIKDEIRRNSDTNFKGKFIFSIMYEAISGAYGSVQDGILAIRYTLTEISRRGIGVSQEADNSIIEDAREFSRGQGKELTVLVGECVERSEAYWNGIQIEPGNGMRRLYFPDTKEEFQYEIPSVKWNRDGTPKSKQVTEHLQVAIAGHGKQVPVELLGNVMTSWWDTWYIRPKDSFESNEAWEKHKATVYAVRDRIFQQFEGYESLELISREEREKIKPEVNSEFKPLKVAMWHNAENIIDIPYQTLIIAPWELVRHPEHGGIYQELFKEQHERFGKFLQDQGVELVSPDTEKAFCQSFTRDPGFVIGDTLFVGRMRDHYRLQEVSGLESVKGRAENVIEIEQGIIEGGDIMVLENDVVLVGIGDTTNRQGYESLRSHLTSKGKEAIAIPHRALHLDCALAPLPNGNALYSQKRLPEESIDILNKHFGDLIPLDPEEDEKHLAANILWLSPTHAVSNVNARKTNEILRQLGYTVSELEYSQPVRLWGSLRCAVGPLVRQD